MAASLPAAMASMTNFGPVTTSPPANTSGCAVWQVRASAMTVPFLVRAMRLNYSNMTDEKIVKGITILADVIKANMALLLDAP